MPRPSLEVGRDYRDASMAIVKPRFAGFCGSDRGIWLRRSFGDMIREIKVHRKVLFRL